jgi:uncharacterized protein (TIGR00255 family)
LPFDEVGVLLSMTGYGDARLHSEQLDVAIELRALNNRYLKVSLRAAEPYNLLESEFEKAIRRIVRRGTIQVQLRCDSPRTTADLRINVGAVRGYLGQLRGLAEEFGFRGGAEAFAGQLLALPGVVPEPGADNLQFEEEWPFIERTLNQALTKLQAMRQEEGAAMANEFLQLRQAIETQLGRIREKAPGVANAYRDRLHERVRTLLAELDIEIDRKDVIREVSIFAERSDVSEEVTRLASHLDQFRDILDEPESPGRKLEFLTQEMFREANTIGSKAGDVEISRCVVEIKGTLEKMRELVQNVE